MPSSSDQKPMIYVQTLGGFSIKTGNLQIPSLGFSTLFFES